MPDPNKFAKLREIKFHIPVVCSLCVHGEFGHGMWGTCALHRYEHKKHDNPENGRGVSIPVMGTCPDAELDPTRTHKIGAHTEFLKAP